MYKKISGFVRQVGCAALDLLYPRVCAGCGQPAGYSGHLLCGDCLLGLPLIHPPYCRCCGDPVEGQIEHAYECSFCRRRRPFFRAARSAVRYRGSVRNVIRSFKYTGMTALAEDCAPLIVATVRAHYASIPFDAVVGVPLHRRRERIRGFNQSAILAHCVGKMLGVPAPQVVLDRRRDTPTQTGLSMAQRRGNVRNAFVVERPAWIEGRRILLVDDVMTTGATVNACSRALMDAGAASVHVATVARG